MNGVLFSDLCQPMNSGKIQTCCYIIRTAETLTVYQSCGPFSLREDERGIKALRVTLWLTPCFMFLSIACLGSYCAFNLCARYLTGQFLQHSLLFFSPNRVLMCFCQYSCQQQQAARAAHVLEALANRKVMKVSGRGLRTLSCYHLPRHVFGNIY